MWGILRVHAPPANRATNDAASAICFIVLPGESFPVYLSFGVEILGRYPHLQTALPLSQYICSHEDPFLKVQYLHPKQQLFPQKIVEILVDRLAGIALLEMLTPVPTCV